MSYPTANLVARFEPKDWGYSDGDVINTSTKKFTDGSGNARHLADTVTGSPTYKTNRTPSGAAAVNFDGSSDCRGNWIVGQAGSHSVYAVVIPRTGATHSLCVCCWTEASHVDFYGLISIDDQVSPLRWRAFEVVSTGSLTGIQASQTSGTIPTIDVCQYIGCVRKDTVTRSLVVRVDGTLGGTFSGTDGAISGTASYFIAGGQGLSGTTNMWKGDIAAIFVYSVQLTGSDLSDLESYLAQTYIAVSNVDSMVAGTYTDTGRVLTGQSYSSVLPVGSYIVTGHEPKIIVTDQVPAGSYVYTGRIGTDAFGDILPAGIYTVVGYVPMAGLVEPMPSGLYVIAGQTLGTILVRGVFTPSNLDRNAIFAAGGSDQIIFAPGDSNGRIF